jgi:5-methylcytosine-specific restriction endonuclease McrA
MFMLEQTARERSERLAELFSRERLAMAEFLLALVKFDQKRLWSALGYANLFTYLHRELGMSRATAYYRMSAARLIREFPEVLESLRNGRLCITVVAELAKVLTRENCSAVLPRFFSLSMREAKAVSAVLAPSGAPPLRDEVEPLTADLRRIHLTVSREFEKKLEEARAALSHKYPYGRLEEIFAEGLDLILKEHARRKGALRARQPQKAAEATRQGTESVVTGDHQSEAPERNDYIPRPVKRAVWERDRGKCQWPVTSGGRCGSNVRVQFDHVVPRSLGGLATVGNIRLLCAEHNILAARRILGDAVIDRYVQGLPAG